MYSAKSRSRLKEKLEYERMVMRECVLTMVRSKGVVSARTAVIEDGKAKIDVLLGSGTGSEPASKVVNNLAPLIFVSSYKTIDMIFEWILEENRSKFGRGFEQKINVLNKQLKQLRSLELPSAFGVDIEIFEVFLALYDRLRLYRNHLIHHGWGNVSEKGLEFKTPKKKTISFQEVINLADAASLLADSLVVAAGPVPLVEDIKFLLDQIHGLHNGHMFNTEMPGVATVVYICNVDEGEIPIIDLDLVQSKFPTSRITLFVNVNENGIINKWRFDSWDLLGMNELVLDETWDTYRM